MCSEGNGAEAGQGGLVNCRTGGSKNPWTVLPSMTYMVATCSGLTGAGLVGPGDLPSRVGK